MIGAFICRHLGHDRDWPEMERCARCCAPMPLVEGEDPYALPPAHARRRRWAARLTAALIVAGIVWLLASEPAYAADAGRKPPVTEAGQALIVKFEVGSRAQYEAKYQRPICPACATTASGVTVGIGYDLRHQPAATIRRDWASHPQLSRLLSAQGLGGAAAIAKARELRDVVVTWPQANAVFRDATLPKYRDIARRSFGPGFDAASPQVQDALVSVVFNRGGSTVGPGRLEFRVIRDRCLPDGIPSCTAGQIRAMTRLWRGTEIEAGMTRRRYAEAAHAES